MIFFNTIDDKMEVGMDFGWLLDRFLVDLGTKLGGKLGSSWHFNPIKLDTKTMSTNHQKSGAARVRRWHAVVRRWSWVLAPEESLRDPLILEYKRKAIGPRNTPSRAQGPGADIEQRQKRDERRDTDAL